MAPLSLPLAWFLALATPGQLSPEKQGTSFTVSPGLEFKIWAAEPLFVNPTTFDIDPAGRIWVCEAVNYRRRLRGQPPLRSEGDRVVIVADTNGDGTLSQAEIARSINQAAGNGGKVTAMVVTVSGSSQMVLTSGQTGASGAITLDASGLPTGALKTALSTANQLTAANDAIAWLGNQGTGIKLQQASNTLNAIPGVTVSLTQAMATGAAPLTLTVARDDGATAANVKGFVDAYNTLEKALDDLTQAGSADGNTQAGAFASDSSVRALRNHLHSLLRQDFGGQNLLNFGISADRYGQLSVNNTKLSAALTANPTGLDQVFGKTGITTGSGLLGGMDQYLDVWLNSATGQIKHRQDGVQKVQKSLTDRQTKLDNQYSAYYERYLAQFTRLQTLQSQMSQTTGLLNNTFSA